MQPAEGGPSPVAGKQAAQQRMNIGHFVFDIDFMVKLLRVCVWMPWRKEAKKDVISCDKLREDANNL
jgi:hypothetical protein